MRGSAGGGFLVSPVVNKVTDASGCSFFYRALHQHLCILNAVYEDGFSELVVDPNLRDVTFVIRVTISCSPHIQSQNPPLAAVAC